ncbi:MAG: hypothetical protein AAGH46_06560 [Bacteroidota bacterium]
MKKSNRKRNLVLSILFFLPVLFLLMLYPAKHNYTPLDIVNEKVNEFHNFKSDSGSEILLSDHITIIGFLGYNPISNSIAASNLKELIYDKFKGFKKFQIVIVQPYGSEQAVEQLKKEINSYQDLRFWHYVFANEEQISELYKSLKSSKALDQYLATDLVFVVDKDLNQRGRIDARDKKEIEEKKPEYSLYDYDCIEIDQIKNKMSEDLRILFTEYRQKRKGQFDSSTRRASDLKIDNG